MKAGLIQELSPELTGKQRGVLRSMAHNQKPIVHIGQHGVTDAVSAQVRGALLSHELIKVKVLGGDLDSVATALRSSTGASIVQGIGKVLVLFKPNPDDPKISV